MPQDSMEAPHNPPIIRTPDQRVRVFVSSTLQELAEERAAAKEAITHLHLTPVMFELGARPHPPRDLYRAYLSQSHIFVGIYWQRYGWVAPDMTISGLEDEYRLVGDRLKLIYVKVPAPDRESRLSGMLDEIKNAGLSYKPFNVAAELGRLIEDDLSLLMSERFEVSFRDEASPVPTEATAPVRHDNLPVPTSSLIGRERDIEAIATLLLRGDVRLVTLIGPGGIGKTRLCLEVARQVKENFASGVCFVPLVNARDVDGVAAAIAGAMRLAEFSADVRPAREKVLDALHDRQILLVLDNCEQALDAVPFISELLTASPRLEVLASSRAILHLQGEYGYDVKPLGIPPIHQTVTTESLYGYEAVHLFVERARASKSDFTLTDANAAAVAEITRKLDGLPLAIELAAARSRLLTPQALLARLDNTLQTLTAGARDLPVRQQTLRNTLDWSYSLLLPAEQALFARFAIFESGCSLNAAQDVLCVPPLTDADAIDSLASLVDKSLVQQTDVDGEPRFAMLQTIREYAHEKLRTSGEAELMRKRHADYFHRLIFQAQREMHAPNESTWFDKLNNDTDNLQAIVRSYLQDGAHDVAAHIAWTLWHFWLANSNMTEWQQWADAMMSRLSDESSARAKAVTLRGSVAVWQGDYERGIPLIQQGADMFGRLGKTDNQTEAMMLLGLALLNKGDRAAASAVMAQGLGLPPTP